jgi:hypothetical protein
MMESPNAYGPISREFYKLTGNIEREFVRIPALLAIESALRGSIKDPEARYQVAASQMFRSMAGTTRSNTPLFYHKAGPFGSMLRTMKSYSTNWHGQFAEHFLEASRAGFDMAHLKPLASFIGTAALLGGVNGLIGVQEADGVITLLNALTNSNIRTPQEWIMTGGNSQAARDAGGTNLGPDLTGLWDAHPNVRDVATHGAASLAVGRDISTQVSPPSIESLVTVVPAKLPIGMAGPIIEYLVAAVQGQLTDSIRMKAYEGITLNNPHAKALIEEYFQKPGQPVPRPYLNMGGNFYRTPSEYSDAEITGAMGLDEKKADLLLNFFKRNEARLEKDRANTQKSMVDDILNDEGVSDDKMQKYIESGGDPKSLTESLKNAVVQRNVPQLQAQMLHKGKAGMPFVAKMEHLQPYISQDPALRELSRMK